MSIENPVGKTPKELDHQLGRAESLLGGKIEPEHVRSDLLSLDLNSLRERHPEEYRLYISALRTEAGLLHFPDMDRSAGGNTEKPTIDLMPAGVRGYAFRVNFSDNAHVIKPLESRAEQDIASRASALGIGPRQFKTNEGFLHEEFIEGTPLLGLDTNTCTPEYMERLGEAFSQALKKLHDNDILVNDQILTDDFGKSHMIIDKNGKVRFVDFGASIDLGSFPNIPDDAVLSLMRTDPFMAFRMGNVSDASEEKKQAEIRGYRENILSQFKTKEDVIQWKDVQLLNEGLSFLQSRLPNVQFFIEGIRKGLS